MHSFTKKLFERMRKSGGRITMTSTLPGTVRRPRSYDDIDKFGLRPWYQKNLPAACAFEVESAMLSIKRNPVKRPIYFLVTDRWFPDILAYTVQEAPDDPDLHADVASRCLETYRSLTQPVGEQFHPSTELNIFVPLSVSNFPVEGQEGKFRATGDRDMFENTCLDGWSKTLRRVQPHLVVSESDRKARLIQVMQTIDDTHSRHKNR